MGTRIRLAAPGCKPGVLINHSGFESLAHDFARVAHFPAWSRKVPERREYKQGAFSIEFTVVTLATTMYRNPNNYFIGVHRGAPKPCECCDHPIIMSYKSPAVYGSGRFCSELCSKLRTPEKHWNWMSEHPDEYKKWKEWKKEQEARPNENALGGVRILPI